MIRTTLFALTLLATPVWAQDAAPLQGDPAKGKIVSAKCKACHTFNKGGPKRVGPNQWNVYGSKIAERDGFTYSKAFMDKKGTLTWDDATLDTYLENPKKMIPGTKMVFVGVKDAQQRADLIAWLKTLRDDPAAEAAPAE